MGVEGSVERVWVGVEGEACRGVNGRGGVERV